MGVFADVLTAYDKEVGVTEASGSHSVTGSTKDVNMILQQLLESNVFAHVNHHKHNFFRSIQRDSLSSVDKKKLIKWIVPN